MSTNSPSKEDAAASEISLFREEIKKRNLETSKPVESKEFVENHNDNISLAASSCSESESGHSTGDSSFEEDLSIQELLFRAKQRLSQPNIKTHWEQKSLAPFIGSDSHHYATTSTRYLEKQIVDLKEQLHMAEKKKIDIANRCREVEEKLTEQSSTYQTKIINLQRENKELNEQRANMKQEYMNQVSEVLNQLHTTEEIFKQKLIDRDAMISTLQQTILIAKQENKDVNFDLNISNEKDMNGVTRFDSAEKNLVTLQNQARKVPDLEKKLEKCQKEILELKTEKENIYKQMGMKFAIDSLDLTAQNNMQLEQEMNRLATDDLQEVSDHEFRDDDQRSCKENVEYINSSSRPPKKLLDSADQFKNDVRCHRDQYLVFIEDPSFGKALPVSFEDESISCANSSDSFSISSPIVNVAVDDAIAELNSFGISFPSPPTKINENSTWKSFSSFGHEQTVPLSPSPENVSNRVQWC